MARRAPAAARPWAMARPISRRAPVTRAVRLVRRKRAKGSGMSGSRRGRDDRRRWVYHRTIRRAAGATGRRALRPLLATDATIDEVYRGYRRMPFGTST